MQMQSFEKYFVNSPLWSWLMQRLFLPWLFRLMDARTIQNGLELGCGQGVTTAEILKHLPVIRLTAVDCDSEQVGRARRRLARFGNRVCVQKSDATMLAFAGSEFDAVFACNVFHHIHEYRQALREAFRVLKPSGELYVMEIDSRTINPVSRRLFPAEAFFTRQDFVRDLKEAGFAVEHSSGSRIFYVGAKKPPPMGKFSLPEPANEFAGSPDESVLETVGDLNATPKLQRE
jgi:ubiquinone/menaquinone biosynthesis C-methylase UbiE